ncbi:hypothetical protein, partial [Chromobacterium violaceum]|uniref:hypothetical protein n=1 Tax=Chromobacterium violaceum TaxID=536 RepID=UPI001A96A54E
FPLAFAQHLDACAIHQQMQCRLVFLATPTSHIHSICLHSHLLKALRSKAFHVWNTVPSLGQLMGTNR